MLTDIRARLKKSLDNYLRELSHPITKRACQLSNEAIKTILQQSPKAGIPYNDQVRLVDSVHDNFDLYIDTAINEWTEKIGFQDYVTSSVP